MYATANMPKAETLNLFWWYLECDLIYNERVIGSKHSQTVVIHVPYADTNSQTVQSEVEEQLSEYEKEHLPEVSSQGKSAFEDSFKKLIFHYPTVYIVHSQEGKSESQNPRYVAYVGETNDIHARTLQHLNNDVMHREDWKTFSEQLSQNPDSVKQYVIGNEYFNKSLTLDIENKMMHFLLGNDAVSSLNNRRTNAQGDYYTQDKLNEVFSEIWLQLHQQDPQLFPSEQIIRDSALFKASPFHKLNEEQIAAEEAILEALADALSQSHHETANSGQAYDANAQSTSDERDGSEPKTSQSEYPRLIFVQGAAGTGKTVLLSHLFYRIMTELDEGLFFDVSDQSEDITVSESNKNEKENSKFSEKEAKHLRACLLVNHEQQRLVYDQIALKLELQKKMKEVVQLPSTFIKNFAEVNSNSESSESLDTADVVLIDEAHLLLTQGNQGFSGKYMLLDILKRAKVVIAVFDKNQTLQSAQRWNDAQLKKLFPEPPLSGYSSNGRLESFQPVEIEGNKFMLSHLRLEHQFRIDACGAVIKWIDDFAAGRGIGPIPSDDITEHRNHQSGKDERPFEIRVFDSPVDLFQAIREKASEKAGGVDGHGLSRVVATYDWDYTGGKKNPDSPDGFWNVEMHRVDDGTWEMGLARDDKSGFNFDDPDGDDSRFCHPWNFQLKKPRARKGLTTPVWAEQSYTVDEVGSTYTIQGFDLNYVGVIIGPSVAFREGKIVFDGSASKNAKATNKREGKYDYSEDNLRNELNVLLKRGVHGLYLFAVDKGLQRELKRQSIAGQHES